MKTQTGIQFLSRWSQCQRCYEYAQISRAMWGVQRGRCEVPRYLWVRARERKLPLPCGIAMDTVLTKNIPLKNVATIPSENTIHICYWCQLQNFWTLFQRFWITNMQLWRYTENQISLSTHNGENRVKKWLAVRRICRFVQTNLLWDL